MQIYETFSDILSSFICTIWYNSQYNVNLLHLHARVCCLPVTTLCQFKCDVSRRVWSRPMHSIGLYFNRFVTYIDGLQIKRCLFNENNERFASSLDSAVLEIGMVYYNFTKLHCPCMWLKQCSKRRKIPLKYYLWCKSSQIKTFKNVKSWQEWKNCEHILHLWNTMLLDTLSEVEISSCWQFQMAL